jgi:hypothetical protein
VVWYRFTDVSETRTASVLRVEEAEKEASGQAPDKLKNLPVASTLDPMFDPEMDAVASSKTIRFYQFFPIIQSVVISGHV